MIREGSVVYGVFGGMMLDSYFKTLGEAKAYAKEKAKRLRDAKLHTDMRVRVVKMEVMEETLVPKSNEPYGEIRLNQGHRRDGSWQMTIGHGGVVTPPFLCQSDSSEEPRC